MSDFKTFLKQLAVVLKFTTLAPDKQGACLVVMKKSNTPLLFEFDDHLVPNTILLSTPVGEVSGSIARTTYLEVLKGNEKMEETLSIKPDEELIYLHRRLSPLIEANELKLVLDRFLRATQHWKELFEKMIQENPADEPEPPSTPKPYRFKV